MTPTADPRPRVLIVDDFGDARDMYAEWLTFKGYDVVTAADGEQAVAQAEAQRPDVILLDLRMPGLTGYQTLHVLRRDPAFADVPIAALTAHALDEERGEALAAGFDMFLAKPCLPDELLVAIEQLLRRRQES
jgi:two-component system, cell cycle response regulator DivK